MDNFFSVWDRLNVPLANEKTVAPTTIVEYLGLTIDTGKMIIKIPENEPAKKKSFK
jgi:hypothetical protein